MDVRRLKKGENNGLSDEDSVDLSEKKKPVYVNFPNALAEPMSFKKWEKLSGKLSHLPF